MNKTEQTNKERKQMTREERFHEASQALKSLLDSRKLKTGLRVDIGCAVLCSSDALDSKLLTFYVALFLQIICMIVVC